MLKKIRLFTLWKEWTSKSKIFLFYKCFLLLGEKKVKKEAKAKKVREKTVIVKDIKPMLDDLLNIEDEIKKVSII